MWLRIILRRAVVSVQIILIALIESVHILLTLLAHGRMKLPWLLLPRRELILINFIRLRDILPGVLLRFIIYLLLLLLLKVLPLDLMVIHEFEIGHVLEILVRKIIQV